MNAITETQTAVSRCSDVWTSAHAGGLSSQHRFCLLDQSSCFRVDDASAKACCTANDPQVGTSLEQVEVREYDELSEWRSWRPLWYVRERERLARRSIFRSAVCRELLCGKWCNFFRKRRYTASASGRILDIAICRGRSWRCVATYFGRASSFHDSLLYQWNKK